MGIIFRQFLAEGGCNSFIIADEAARKACIVDPRADLQPLYEAFLGARALKVSLVLDTHTHADHYSGSHLVAEGFGARIAMSEATGSARADLKLTDKQLLEVGGDVHLEILATPGHTPDSLTVLVKAPGLQAALTGDTLFIGGSGRTDFPGADASQQYDSIYGRLAALADGTWVFPGHDYAGNLFSTISHEKRTNAHWKFASRQDFVLFKEAEKLDSPGAIPAVVNFNLAERPRNSPRAGVVTLCATTCREELTPIKRLDAAAWAAVLGGREAGSLFIDVREPEEFARARIEGVMNIPLSEIFLRWKELAAARVLYFMCDRGLRSLTAAQTASRLGLTGVVDLAGGLISWIAAGKPVRKD